MSRQSARRMSLFALLLSCGLAHAEQARYLVEFRGKPLGELRATSNNQAGLQHFYSVITMQRGDKTASLVSKTAFRADMTATLKYEITSEVQGRAKYEVTFQPSADGWNETMRWLRDGDETLDPATVKTHTHSSEQRRMLHMMELPLVCPLLLPADGSVTALLPTPSKRLKDSILRDGSKGHLATLTRTTNETGDVEYAVVTDNETVATLKYSAEMAFQSMQLGDNGPMIIPAR